MNIDNSSNAPISFKLANESSISKEHFQSIFEQSPLGIALIDSITGKFCEVNARYVEIMERSEKELLSLNWMNITHPEDIQHFLDNLNELQTGKITEFTQDKRYLRLDGSFYWVNITLTLLNVEKTSVKYLLIAKTIEDSNLAINSPKKLGILIDNILDALIQIDSNGIICDWNTQAGKIFDWNKEEIIGQPLYGVIFPSRYRKLHGEELKKFLASGKELFFNSKIEVYALHRNGYEFPIELSLVAIKTSHTHYEFYAFIRDMSQRKKSEKQLIESEHRYRLLFKFSPYSIYEIDLEGKFLSVNTAGLKILDLTDEKHILGKPFLESVHSEDKENIKILFKKAILGIASNFEFTSAGMNPQYLKACFIPIEDNAGRVTRLMALVENITQQKESEMLIWQQANFDSLTKLPNRTMLYDRLTQEIKKTSSSKKLTLALLVIDIDRFKDINVVLGHEGGDIFLREVALRLKECVLDTDLVTRLGGDEFALILSEVKDPNSIEIVAEKILQKFSDIFQLNSQSVQATVSIGISLFPEDGIKMETLLKNAEQAMHAAQTEGGNRYNYFTPFMQKAAQVRMQIASDLRVALDNNEFQLHYQPIINFKTGQIHKAEALIRWQHPERGLISPVAFIPIAEENRMIIDIGNWVFHEAANQVKRWREAYYPDFQISINKSPVQFHDEHSVHEAWLAYLKKCNLPGESVVIEITEGFLLDINPTVIERLLKFREAGVQISLDDFGTGYSSLSYLKKFKIDYIKIDRSFVSHLEENSDDIILCEAIIVMAHKLGIQVIAEGIETKKQCDLLIAADCDYGQGYLFSRPVLPAEFDKVIQQSLMDTR